MSDIVYSKEKGLRQLKEGRSFEAYKAKYPSAIIIDHMPSMEELEAWSYDSKCETPDGCEVEPDGVCPHGYPSWLIILNLI